LTATSINFGQDALNYYDEGTFTPVLAFGGASVGITYTTQSGKYTRVGNMVCYEITIILSSKGSSVGGARISGLPFTSGSLYATAPVYMEEVAFTSPSFYMPPSTAYLLIVDLVSTGVPTAIVDTAFENGSVIITSGAYLT
jgi:hypothetical protein